MDTIAPRKQTVLNLSTELMDKLVEMAKVSNCSLERLIENVLADFASTNGQELTMKTLDDARHGRYAGELDVSSLENMYKSLGL